MRPQPWLIVVLVGAVLGLVFAGVSTYDFVQHLDRQVHNIHCSFVPGIGVEKGASGCQVAMMSPYSSVFRTSIWGGIPISLPAMSVFAFLLFYAIDLAISRRQDDPRATAFLALAAGLPALTSVVMLVISLTVLGTTCKLCIGIYVASAACLTGAIVLWRRALRTGPRPAPRVRAAPTPPRTSEDPAWAGGSQPALHEPAVAVEPARTDGVTTTGLLAGAFAAGVVFVLAPVVLYAAVAPDHSRFVGTCDRLPHP